MDDWRKRLATKLLGDKGTPSLALDARTTLEIAFGRARSEVTYVLELGRAHALPLAGSVTGDDVWLRIGESVLRFRLDRQALAIVAFVPGAKDTTFSFDADLRTLVTAQRRPVDFDQFVKDSLETIVQGWDQGMRAPSETLPDIPSTMDPVPSKEG
ncbi:MAG: hypothetical protein IPK71_25450 [Myxococcales bacterium]|jgi:hypothetical protein|nr:hypothetical protein [Myxococcales bacterium]